MKFWTALFVLFAFAGCKNIAEFSVTETRESSNVCVVVVGMDRSQFAGSCPGAEYDAKRMAKLLSAYTPNVVSFVNENATKSAVKGAMLNAARNSDLFIFYYSGHGGSQRFADTGPEETDGKDEFLCLYDTYMRDNEVWSILSQCKGRVFCIFDCCHSQTMFRLPSPVSLKRAIPMAATHHEAGNMNLLVWSGCPDNTYSYGSIYGGKLTNTILAKFDFRKTYDALWTEIENDKDLRKFEEVQRTIMGNGFTARPIFQ